MAKTKEKVTFSLDAGLVAWVDQRVQEGEFDSRSAALELALAAFMEQQEERRYESALSLLDPAEEQALAEEGMADYSRLVEGAP